MAWTNPTTQSTGTLITATIWNTDIVDNLTALRSGSLAITSQGANEIIYASSSSQLARSSSFTFNGSTLSAPAATFTGTLAWGGGSAISSSSNVALLAGAAFTGATSITTSVDAPSGLTIDNNSLGTTASAVLWLSNSGSTNAGFHLGGASRATYANVGPNVLYAYTDNAAGIAFLVDTAGPITFATNASTRLSITSSGAATFTGVVSLTSSLGALRQYEGADFWSVYHYTDQSWRLNYNDSGNDELILDTSGALSVLGAVTTGKYFAGARGSVTLVDDGGGVDQNVNIGDNSFVVLTGSAATSVGGFTGGVDGRILFVRAPDTLITFVEEDAGSTAANRIANITGTTPLLDQGALGIFIYDGNIQRWIAIKGN